MPSRPLVLDFTVARQVPRVCMRAAPVADQPVRRRGSRSQTNMADLILRAEPRTVVGKKVKQLRREGLVPGVIYGPGLSGTTTIQVSVVRRDFDKFYLAHGQSTLFGIDWDGKSEQVFIREVQIEPVKRTAVHID